MPARGARAVATGVMPAPGIGGLDRGDLGGPARSACIHWGRGRWGGACPLLERVSRSFASGAIGGVSRGTCGDAPPGSPAMAGAGPPCAWGLRFVAGTCSARMPAGIPGPRPGVDAKRRCRETAPSQSSWFVGSYDHRSR